VYADCSGGWTTHVAGRKFKHNVPDSIKALYPKTVDDSWVDKYMVAEEAFTAWRNTFPYDETPCNYLQKDGSTKKGVHRSPKDSEYSDLSEVGPEAGESFNHSTPGECADFLKSLKLKGFRVPDYAIEALEEEQTEMDGENVKS
jgi:hypothetical protein